MSGSDKLLIKKFQKMGFRVVIRNLNAKTFSGRFEVFQNIGFENLKRVLVSKNGKTSGFQG